MTTIVTRLQVILVCLFLFQITSRAEDAVFRAKPDTGGLSLPVRLESFTLSLTNTNEVMVEWITAEQWTSVRYEVQRSANNATFESVGYVTLASSIDPQKNFSFSDFLSDQELRASQWYYRIKQIDDKGNVSYSYVRVLKLVNDQDLVTSVFPNPSYGECNIGVFSVARTDLSILFYDMNGNVSLMKKVSVSGQQQIILDEVQQLKKGLYMMQVVFGQRKTISLRFIKQ